MTCPSTTTAAATTKATGVTARAWVAITLSALMSVMSVRSAHADEEADQARAFHEKAKAAFALSHYGQAAEFFEKAFELKSDPALLYNAAQSHRLAGNKERALTLYQNYLHVYGRDDRRAQIESRIDELKRSIERDRKEIPARPPAGWPPAVTTPPASTGPAASAPGSESFRSAPPAARVTPPPPAPSVAPPETPPPSLPALAPPPPPSSSPPVLLTQGSGGAREEDKSLTQKPWFWVAAGGGVAAAAVVVLLLTMGGSKDPSASLGQAHGN